MHAVANPSALAWVLVTGVVFAVLAAYLVVRGAAGLGGSVVNLGDGVGVAPKRIAAWSVAWLAALALGVVLSNNLLNGLTDGQLRSLLGDVLPGYRTQMMSRELFGEDLSAGLSFPKFSGIECMATGTCANASTFLADWGFFAVVALATWIALGQAVSSAAGQARRAVWLLMVAAVGTSFLLVDFTGGEPRHGLDPHPVHRGAVLRVVRACGDHVCGVSQQGDQMGRRGRSGRLEHGADRGQPRSSAIDEERGLADPGHCGIAQASKISLRQHPALKCLGHQP